MSDEGEHASSEAEFRVERVYDLDGPSGGVLVDRLWPRGISKADLAKVRWCKDVAPSTDLRRWYGHDTDRFEEFRERYRAELAEPPADAEVARLVEEARASAPEPLLLITATRDVEHSGAEVLRTHLEAQLDGTDREAEG